MLTPHPAFPRRMWLTGRPSLRGLGQDASSGDYGGEAGPAVDPSTGTTIDPSQLPLTLPSYTPTVPLVSTGSASTSSGAGTPSALTQILNALTGVTKTTAQVYAQQNNPLLNLAPGTYYQSGPAGTTITTAGATVPATALTSGLTSATLGNLLPIGLVAGVVLLLMMSRR